MTRISAPPSGDTSARPAPSRFWYFGARNLSLAGRLTHSWMPWNKPPDSTSSAGVSRCRDSCTGGHPLGGAVLDEAAATGGVLVLEAAVDHVRDRLESAVRVPRRAAGLAGLVIDLAHLVHVDERVEGGAAHAGERAHDGEALALVAAWTGGDRGDGAVDGARARLGQAGQRQRICGDSRHCGLPSGFQNSSNLNYLTVATNGGRVLFPTCQTEEIGR